MEKTIDEELFQLKKQIEKATAKGVRGAVLSQRIEDDLKRIMISGWLTLDEFMDSADKIEQLTP